MAKKASKTLAGEAKGQPTATEALERAALEACPNNKSRILVAVSGGPDSVALLRTLHQLSLAQKERKWELRIGHVQHGLRGAESMEDERFVCELGEGLGLEVDVRRVPTKTYALEHRLSVEAAARQLRYEALGELLDAWGGDLIAAGHTQEDQAETLLLNLLRGTGLAGLRGMAVSGHRLVRPFLTVARSLILEALSEWGQEYRIDSSNQDQRYRRNPIRNDVMPLLNSIQPSATANIARAASILSRESDYLEQEASEALRLLDCREEEGEVRASLTAWLALAPSLQRSVLRLLLQALLGSTVDIGEAHIELLCDWLQEASRKEFHGQLPFGLVLLVDGPEFSLRQHLPSRPAPAPPIELNVPGTADWNSGCLIGSFLSDEDRDCLPQLIAVAGPYHAFCDFAASGSTLEIRAWLPGDRMRPFGGQGTRKLQDIFADRHVPESERHEIPIVQSGGRIVWIVGLVLAEDVRVHADTQRVLHLRWLPKAGLEP